MMWAFEYERRCYSLWIYLFFPLPAQCICFYPHECICFSLWIYLCVFAGGIPASLSHIPGSQPVVIPPSVDMSEFVDFSPLPRTRTWLYKLVFVRFQDGRPKLLSYHMWKGSPKSDKIIFDRLWADVMKAVLKMTKSESCLIVFKFTFFDVYL